MRAINLFIILLYFCGIVYSQNGNVLQSDTISFNDMIKNFLQKKVPSRSINFYDQIKGVGSMNTARLITSPLKLENLGLSVGDCTAVWEVYYSQLILKEILPIGMSKQQADEIFAILARRFGGKNERGIFVSWFTGILHALDCPYDLFGEWVSKDKISLGVKKGYVTIYDPCGIPEGTMHSCKKELFIFDGCWTQNLSEISCLEGFIDRNFESAFTLTKKIYTLLLFTDLTGRSDIYILEPHCLGWYDNIIIKRLKRVIQMLSLGSFKYMETLDGKLFQGRYLKAKYTYRHGWKLKDYIH